MWVGGILLGVGNICLFLVKSPWLSTSGYINLGENFYNTLGLFDFSKTKPFFKHSYAMLCLFILVGAFTASLLAREFVIRIPPAGELLKGFMGGALMALGATMGGGCAIGGFFSGWSALSGGAIVLALGMTIGTICGLKYLLWEMENLPGLSSGKGKSLLLCTNWQPWFGGVILLIITILNSILNKNNDVMTWFIVLGVLFGIICQRSRFCIVKALREPFMTGESSASLGLMAGLLVSIFGFCVIKYMGVATTNYEEARHLALIGVSSNFWLRALIGGFIFGIGMTIAGGCTVGALWRAGEGQVKLWASILGLVLVSPISERFISPAFKEILPAWGKTKFFLPDVFGYGGTMILFLTIILVWYLFVKWNEKTGRFSAI